jgi:hypothetical protein
VWTWAKGQNLIEDVATDGHFIPGEMRGRRLTSVLFKRVRKIAKGDCELRHVSPFSRMNYSAATVRFFIQFDFSVFLKNLSKNQVSLKSDKNNGYFT